MTRLLRCTALALLPLLAACGGDIAPGRSSAEPPAVKGLTIESAGTSALPAGEFLPATVESVDRGVLAARLDGRVATVKVKAGDRVAAGALLLTLADTPVGDQLNAAEGERRAAASRAELAGQTLARYERLRASEAVTPLEYDRVAAEASAARSSLAAAEALAAAARTRAGYSRVTAPYAARVAQVAVEAGATVMPGTPLVVLDRSSGWQLLFACPEALAGQLAIGAALQAEIPSLQRSVTATVSEIAPAADPASRSVQVKATLADDPQLTAGLYARVAVGTAPVERLLLPATAVVTRGQLTGVYAVTDGRLQWRLVKTGRTVGERVEILSGLVAGEQVVTAGTERALHGARVER